MENVGFITRKTICKIASKSWFKRLFFITTAFQYELEMKLALIKWQFIPSKTDINYSRSK
jgi:hypothetical protein